MPSASRASSASCCSSWAERCSFGGSTTSASSSPTWPPTSRGCRRWDSRLRARTTNPEYHSHAEYLPCGDTSVELIECGDPAAPRAAAAGRRGRPHRAHRLRGRLAAASRSRDELEARGVEVTWPPIPSGDAEMIWTEASTSGGVQYQFLRRLGREDRLIGAGAIARRHLESWASRDVRSPPWRQRHGLARRGGRGRHRRIDPRRLGGLCSRASGWTRCWSARHRGARGPDTGGARAGHRRCTSRSRSHARPTDGADIAPRMAAAAGVVCAVGYQWRSLDVLDALRDGARRRPSGAAGEPKLRRTEGGRGDLGMLGGRRLLVHRPRPKRRHPVRAGQPRHRSTVRDRRPGGRPCRAWLQAACWRCPGASSRAWTTRSR